jgi:hypothetical protein
LQCFLSYCFSVPYRKNMIFRFFLIRELNCFIYCVSKIVFQEWTPTHSQLVFISLLCIFGLLFMAIYIEWNFNRFIPSRFDRLLIAVSCGYFHGLLSFLVFFFFANGVAFIMEFWESFTFFVNVDTLWTNFFVGLSQFYLFHLIYGVLKNLAARVYCFFIRASGKKYMYCIYLFFVEFVLFI